MRVAMYYSNRDVRLQEMPAPKVGPGELLMRIEASGICGSDVMEWYRKDKVPLVLGHEVAGTVVEAGKGVDRWKVGDRIAVAHHVPCNTCRYCLGGNHTACDTLRRTNFDPGGFAEFVRLPAINVDRGVFAIPDGVSFGEATFAEPLACVLRGQRRAGIKADNSVLVIGSGIAGLLHIRLARALGSGLIMATDVSDYRLGMARRFGADAVIHADENVPARVRELNQGRLADIVIACTGALSAIAQALKSVERGGAVVLFAPTGPGVTIPLSVNDFFWRNDVTLTTSYAASPADYAAVLGLIGSRRVNISEMITHRLPLAEVAAGFKLVAEAGESAKVIIEPQK